MVRSWGPAQNTLKRISLRECMEALDRLADTKTSDEEYGWLLKSNDAIKGVLGNVTSPEKASDAKFRNDNKELIATGYQNACDMAYDLKKCLSEITENGDKYYLKYEGTAADAFKVEFFEDKDAKTTPFLSIETKVDRQPQPEKQPEKKSFDVDAEVKRIYNMSRFNNLGISFPDKSDDGDRQPGD